MTQKIVVSKAGINAGTATNPNDLTYSSDYNTLKYHQSGTVVLEPGGADVIGTVAHNLGYKPFFSAFVNTFTPNFNMIPGRFSDAGNYTHADGWVDDNKLYLKISTNSSSGTFTFRYFVFRNNTGL